MLDMTPTVSVIIPVYNGAKFVARAIESVINQTFTNWELIVVDDGSTDTSKEVISDYVKKDGRIQYHWEPNSGTPAKPKNTAFKYAKGEYVAYLDQDDEWLPEKLEKQLAVFATYPNEKIGLVSCGGYIRHEEGSPKTVPPAMKKDVTLSDLLMYNYIFSNSSVMIPATVVRAVGDRDESKGIGYLEDWDMWVRIAANGYTVKIIEEPLFTYFTHADNVSRATTAVKQAEMLSAFYTKYKELYTQNNIEHAFLKTIGLYYALAKDTEKAREYYRKAIHLKKTYLVPYAGLLLTYANTGMTSKVLAFWHRMKSTISFRKEKS
jgi:glycosyltransferase involved in cell wall biosynthesis